MPKTSTVRWWFALSLAATLPIWLSWVVRGFGGHFTAWVYYSNFNSVVSAAFVTSAVLAAWLLSMPAKYLGLRFTFGYVLVITWLLVAVFYGSNCTEKLFLGTYGVPTKTDEREQESCDE